MGRGDNFCREHALGGWGTLPCPWPGCKYGHVGDNFVDDRFSLVDDKTFTRESFVGVDGEPRYFWIGANDPYGWAIRNTIRSELFRLARPTYGPLYHYTSLESFHAILESEDLWLTDAAYLNDASEIEHGIRLASDVFDGLIAGGSPIAQSLTELTRIPKDERPRVNIACFSSARDSLTQWRAYSRSTVGVALQFTPQTMMMDLGFPRECTLLPVLYDESAKRTLLDCFGRFFGLAYEKDSQRKIRRIKRDPSEKDEEFFPIDGYEEGDRGLFSELVVCCKDSAFADEREVRMVYTEHKHIVERFELTRAEKRFRVAGSFIAPYTTISDVRETEKPRGKPGPSKFPIEEVMIGPHPQGDLAALSVREYLDARGYEHVRVTRSDAPFR